MSEEILYTPEELAKKLKLSKYTIYEMIKRGEIAAHHIGRSIRVSQTQLDHYFMKNKTVENVYDAEIVSEEGLYYALTGGVRICVAADFTGRAKISIAPEEIILSTGTFLCSARNQYKGKVVDSIYDHQSAKVLLDIGIPLITLITRRSMIDMNIQKGDELFAIFKTMSVKVIKSF